MRPAFESGARWVLVLAGLLAAAGCLDDPGAERRLSEIKARLRDAESARRELLAEARRARARSTELSSVVSRLDSSARQAAERRSALARESEALAAVNARLRDEVAGLRKLVPSLRAAADAAGAKGAAGGEEAPEAGGKGTTAYDVKQIVRLLNHSSRNVRYCAGGILRDLKHPSGTDALVAIATTPGDQSARVCATLALGGLKGGKVEKALIRLIRDPVVEIRCQAYEAAGQVASPALVEPMIKAFEAESRRPLRPGHHVQQPLAYAGGSLSRFDDVRAGRSILNALKRTSGKEAKQIGSALWNVKTRALAPDLIEFIEKTEDRRFDAFGSAHGHALAALAKTHDPRGCRVAVRLMMSPDPRMADRARSALMGLAGPEAVEFLAGVLASGEFEGRKLDQRAMVYVVNSLSSVGDPRAAKALLGAAAGKDAHVAGYAARALGRCVDVEMTEDIIEAWSGAARGTPRTRIEEALKSGKYPVTWDVEKRTFVLDAERLKAMREGMKRKGTEEERPRGAEPF